MNIAVVAVYISIMITFKELVKITKILLKN